MYPYQARFSPNPNILPAHQDHSWEAHRDYTRPFWFEEAWQRASLEHISNVTTQIMLVSIIPVQLRGFVTLVVNDQYNTYWASVYSVSNKRNGENDRY